MEKYAPSARRSAAALHGEARGQGSHHQSHRGNRPDTSQAVERPRSFVRRLIDCYRRARSFIASSAPSNSAWLQAILQSLHAGERSASLQVPGENRAFRSAFFISSVLRVVHTLSAASLLVGGQEASLPPPLPLHAPVAATAAAPAAAVPVAVSHQHRWPIERRFSTRKQRTSQRTAPSSCRVSFLAGSRSNYSMLEFDDEDFICSHRPLRRRVARDFERGAGAVGRDAGRPAVAGHRCRWLLLLNVLRPVYSHISLQTELCASNRPETDRIALTCAALKCRALLTSCLEMSQCGSERDCPATLWTIDDRLPASSPRRGRSLARTQREPPSRRRAG